MSGELQRIFLQGLVLGRGLRGVSVHGPGQGGIRTEGFFAGGLRMGTAVLTEGSRAAGSASEEEGS